MLLSGSGNAFVVRGVEDYVFALKETSGAWRHPESGGSPVRIVSASLRLDSRSEWLAQPYSTGAVRRRRALPARGKHAR